jgi:adenylylsulfate kinase-like enzyme
MIVWIIGLSGAGKTTLANEIVAEVRKKTDNVVLIDGDKVREIFGNDLGHTMEDRRRNGARICQLGKFLDEQNINAVCAILSLFPEQRDWNRKNLGQYLEVFIDAPMSDLMARDSKGLYRRFNSGEISDVAGLDIEFPRPENPDILIPNGTTKQALLAFAKPIADRISGRH